MTEFQLISLFLAAITLLNAYYAVKNQREYQQLSLCHAELTALKAEFEAHKHATKEEGDRLRDRIGALEAQNVSLLVEIARLANK